MLAELLELGFTADTVVLLCLCPSELAWAEGGITPAERQLLVARPQPRRPGWQPRRPPLTEWMARVPLPRSLQGRPPDFGAAASGALVTQGLTATSWSPLRADCYASGSLLGLPIRAISMEERALRIAGDLKPCSFHSPSSVSSGHYERSPHRSRTILGSYRLTVSSARAAWARSTRHQIVVVALKFFPHE